MRFFFSGDAFRQLNIWDKSSSCWRHRNESHQLRGGSRGHGIMQGKQNQKIKGWNVYRSILHSGDDGLTKESQKRESENDGRKTL